MPNLVQHLLSQSPVVQIFRLMSQKANCDSIIKCIVINLPCFKTEK